MTSCAADSLPAGLSVAVSSDGNTCEITGTLTATQTATTHTITGTNATGDDSASVSITVNPVAPSFANALAQTYTQNIAITPLSFTNSGGGELTSCAADSLPAGLSVAVSSDGNTCEIIGTLTATQTATTHTITGTNATGDDSASVSITVNPVAPSFANAFSADLHPIPTSLKHAYQ